MTRIDGQHGTTLKMMIFLKKNAVLLADSKKKCTFAPEFVSNDAQMAESVDALVSNTSGATHPGSTPGLGTKKSCK